MFYFPPQIFPGRVGELFLFYAVAPLALYDSNDYLCTFITANDVISTQGKRFLFLRKSGKAKKKRVAAPTSVRAASGITGRDVRLPVFFHFQNHHGQQ